MLPLRTAALAPIPALFLPCAIVLSHMRRPAPRVAWYSTAGPRLSASPACLVASDRGPDRRLERILAESGRLGPASKPVLEINPAHPLIRALAARIGAADKEKFEDIVWLLFDEARLMEGEKPADAPHFAARLTRILLDAASQSAP